jgi:predicted TIM-barrel fold metal-dependent hydrolase
MLARRGEFVAGLAAMGAGMLGATSVGLAAPARRIDVHYHLAASEYVSVLRDHKQSTPSHMTTAFAIEDMDRAGITTAILSVPGPGVWFGDVAEARRLARRCNEDAAALVAANPKRFGFWATMPLPDVEGSLREIEYALDTLKADGIAMFTSYGTKWLGDPAFTPVFDEINRRKAVVYTHPIVPDCCGKTLPGVIPSMIEFATDTTRTMVSLLYNGVASRCSDMKIVFAHGGGTMTSLIDRFTYEARKPEVAKNLPNGVLPELAKFYYDTAQAGTAAPMSALLKIAPLSQIVLGTDFPYRDPLEQVTTVTHNGVFNDRQIKAIQEDNPVRLIPRLRA